MKTRSKKSRPPPAKKRSRKPRRGASTVELGIGGWSVPLHSHIAYLWDTKRDFEEAVGFIAAGLGGSDHGIVVGDESETGRVLSILEKRRIPVKNLERQKRLTLVRPAPSARKFLDRLSRAFEGALAAGAPRIRLMGNVGWNRKSWPTNAELLCFEACLNEITERFPCVLLCLHEVSALTGVIARHGAFGTHAQVLTEGGVIANPFAYLLGRSLRLDSIASALARQQEDRERARRETEMLQAIFDNIPVMISSVDASGRLVLVNREWERVLGWSLEEARRTDILSEAYPDPERRREVLEFMQEAQGRWKDFEARTRDGRVIDTSWVRIGLSDGTRIGFGLDLSERKRLEKGIQTTGAWLAEGQSLSHTGGWALNLASGRLFWSAETFRIFGLEPGLETLSHPLFHDMLQPADYSAAESTIPPEDRSAVQESINRAVAEKIGFEVDHPVIRPDGSLRQIHAVGHPVFGESGEVLEFVGVLMDVTERRRAEESLRKSHGELRALSERLRTVREEERARIAREMHDEVGQALTALQMDVAWLEKKLPFSASLSRVKLLAKLRSMAELIDATTASVQRIATDLRPGVLDELGLPAAIEWYVREFERRAGIACRIRSNLDGAALDPERATAVFRILQEALTNVARHAGATEVEVNLSADDERLVLEIKDNGRGVSEDRIAEGRSLGLLGMRERALSLGGDVSIRGDPSHGTRVILTLPR
jgi:PAS domain S-box-containing protein